ncbi:NusG antitermination factor [Anopheles sinensis]|uniref:NusG antitermination factor n=1 Tax=Anopheles sinensis TaxID=74873 RepID=A0A084W8Q4_ANOSI|nr:NusG antitermination factor [Anopheles sinensis]
MFEENVQDELSLPISQNPSTPAAVNGFSATALRPMLALPNRFRFLLISHHASDQTFPLPQAKVKEKSVVRAEFPQE